MLDQFLCFFTRHQHRIIKSVSKTEPRSTLIHARRWTTADRGRALCRFLTRFVVVTTKHKHEMVAGAGDGLFLNTERLISFYIHRISREKYEDGNEK